MKRRIWSHRGLWIVLGLSALLLRLLFSWKPQWCEQLYARGFFVGLRWIWDYTLAGLSPLPLMYLFWPLVLFVFFRRLRAWRKSVLPSSWLGRLGLFLYSLAGTLGFWLFFFLWSWGFNYARPPIAQQLQIRAEPLNQAQLRAEADWVHAQSQALRLKISNDTSAFAAAAALPEDLEGHLRDCLEQALADFDYPTAGRVRGRLLYPKGSFLRFNFSGMYFPFVAEGHIDPGLHALQLPFTMAHELAHGYGFAGEADCNLWGFVACMYSDNLVVRYSGYLSYWRYVFTELRRLDKSYYQLLRPQMIPGMYWDIEAIYDNLALYPDFFPEINHAIYDSYLKVQGVKEGMLSYNRMLRLVAAWRKKYPVQ